MNEEKLPKVVGAWPSLFLAEGKKQGFGDLSAMISVVSEIREKAISSGKGKVNDTHRFGISVKNSRGEWVPPIPLPYYLMFRRCRCSCGKKFWTMEGYKGHYAFRHILFPPKKS